MDNNGKLDNYDVIRLINEELLNSLSIEIYSTPDYDGETKFNKIVVRLLYLGREISQSETTIP